MQFTFQLRPFHAVFDFAALAGSGSCFQLLIFRQQVIDCDLVLFQLPGEILHLREPLFQHGEGFLFFLPGVQRVNAVQRGFNGSGLPGEGNRLFEKPGGDILNRLLEHRNFPKLIDLIRIYFQDTAAKGITARNQLIEMATASLSDLMKEHPEHRAEAKQDLQLLNAQKMGEHEAEIEKIKNVFLAILRDIKKDIDNGEQPGEAVTAAMFQAMRDALAEQKQKPLSIDDVTAMIAGQIGQLAPMDKETVEMFQQFAKKMIEQAGTK